MSSLITRIQQAARDGARPPDLSTPAHVWGRNNFVVDDTSNWKGQNWNPDISPFVLEPMEAYCDDDISELTCMAGSQVAKTQPFLVCLLWTIIHDPSPTLWVSSTEPVLKIFAKARMWPSLLRCRPTRGLLDTMPLSDQGTFHVYFPGGLLSLTSSEANAELQSTPYRRIILDEARKYKPENFLMVQKRTRTFTWNKMQVILSCPEKEKDHVHQSFLNGDQREWEWVCKHCKIRQPILFRKKNEMGEIVGGLVYDTNKKTRPGVDYNLSEVIKTIRLKCPYCAATYRDEPKNRWMLYKSGIWVPHNLNALPGHRSYHWNAILPIWTRWEDIVVEFINAVKAMRYGDISKLKEFTVETLGEPFKEAERYEIADTPPKHGNYFINERWDGEEFRFMTIDVQQKCFFWVIRAWSMDGDSRLVDEGGGLPASMAGDDDVSLIGEKPCVSYHELRVIQLDYRVLENNVAIDVSHWQTRIIRNTCAFYNPEVDSTWMAFQGVNREDFIHILGNGEKVRRIYSGETLLDAWIGTENDANPEYHPVPFYMFADDACKDQLEALRRSGRWTVASNASRLYKHQLDGEARIQEMNKRTGELEYVWKPVGKYGNHSFDCEKMQIPLASMARLIGIERVERDNELSSRKENQ